MLCYRLISIFKKAHTSNPSSYVVKSSGKRSYKLLYHSKLQCRDLIRIVKHWRDGVEWERPENRPSSYLIALLVIHAYHMLKG